MASIDREVETTRFWAKIILGAFAVPIFLGFIWVGSIDNRASRNSQDIVELRKEISDVEKDIQQILILQERSVTTLEQIKERLGMIEGSR